MVYNNALPREGDIYKVLRIDGHTFELRFGYYAEFERENCEPVVLYPDLSAEKRYTKNGHRIVTAIQEPCSSFEGPEHKVTDACCRDCIHYLQPDAEIGICGCTHNDINSI